MSGVSQPTLRAPTNNAPSSAGVEIGLSRATKGYSGEMKQSKLREPQPPIRVVQVISNLEFGGAQRQVVALANHMDAAAFDVHVCSLSDYVPLADRLDHADRKLHIVQKRFKFDITTVVRLARLFRRLRADIVHAYLFDAQIAASLAGRLSGRSVVIGSERNTDYRLKRRQMLAYRMTRGCIHKMIANSNAGARFNQSLTGQPAERYHVVHNGVDTTLFRPGDPGPVRRELGLAPEHKVIGMFASFKKQKNHPLFLRAMAAVCRRHPEVRLMFVGDKLANNLQQTDSLKREIVALVEELGLQERCVFVGNRRDPERLYPACDLTVLPSDREGTPNVVLESMACGVPVVVSDVSDNAYIVPTGQVGLVVSLNDTEALSQSVSRLIEDNELRRTMGRNARRWVEREFSLERLALKTGDVYRAALAQRNGRRRA